MIQVKILALLVNLLLENPPRLGNNSHTPDKFTIELNDLGECPSAF
jgi:hypothetical protein